MMAGTAGVQPVWSVSWGETALIGFAGIISKNTQLGGQPAIYLWLLAFPTTSLRVPVCLLWFSAGTLFQGGAEHPHLWSCPQATDHQESRAQRGPGHFRSRHSGRRTSGQAGLGAPGPHLCPPPFPAYVNVPSLNLQHHPSSPPVPDGDLPGVSFHVNSIPSLPSSRRQYLLCC